MTKFGQILGIEGGSELARRCLERVQDGWIDNVIFVVNRLAISAPRVGLVGGLFENIPSDRNRFVEHVKSLLLESDVFLTSAPGSTGAIRMVGENQ